MVCGDLLGLEESTDPHRRELGLDDGSVVVAEHRRVDRPGRDGVHEDA